MMFGTDCNWARCGQAPVINAPDWRITTAPVRLRDWGRFLISNAGAAGRPINPL